MRNNCINKLLNLKEVKVKNIIQLETCVKIFLETTPQLHTCPRCGKMTKQIHDYRLQTIKDLPFQLKHCYLVLKKRRYRCSCEKRFFESYYFLAKYQQRSIRLTKYIVNELRNTISIKAVAKRTNVSQTTVTRILDTISYTCPPLKDALSIDEFKGNTSEGKYQYILVNPIKNRVLDILPDPSQAHLSAYFREISKKERYRLKYFVCDMW